MGSISSRARGGNLLVGFAGVPLGPPGLSHLGLRVGGLTAS